MSKKNDTESLQRKISMQRVIMFMQCNPFDEIPLLDI